MSQLRPVCKYQATPIQHTQSCEATPSTWTLDFLPLISHYIMHYFVQGELHNHIKLLNFWFASRFQLHFIFCIHGQHNFESSRIAEMFNDSDGSSTRVFRKRRNILSGFERQVSRAFPHAICCRTKPDSSYRFCRWKDYWATLAIHPITVDQYENQSWTSWCLYCAAKQDICSYTEWSRSHNKASEKTLAGGRANVIQKMRWKRIVL